MGKLGAKRAGTSNAGSDEQKYWRDVLAGRSALAYRFARNFK